MINSFQYKGYSGHVEFYPEERILHGRVLDIDDIVTFEGTTVDELERAFQESVDEYLAYCAEIGKQPEKPFSGRLNLRMPPNLHRRLHIKAEQTGLSINSLILEAIDQRV